MAPGWLEIAGGLVILIVIFRELWESVILPRPSIRKFALGRYLLRGIWLAWRGIGNRIENLPRREAWLAVMGPLGVLLLFASWGLGLVLAYALLIDGVRGEMHPVPPDFGTSLYFSATTLVPLSYGDIVPIGVVARVITVGESVTGVFLAALAITLLFSLYESFQRREEMVVALDAMAGAPPSGTQILETAAERGMRDQLIRTFEEWKGWSAAVLESHLAYPLLFFFRSSHDNEAWLNSFGAVMDAATLLISSVDDETDGPARLMYTVGNHLAEDMAWYFRYPQRNDPIVEKEEFEQAWKRLRASGYHCKNAEDGWNKFAHLRGSYASSLNQLARFLNIIPAQWIGDRSYLPHRGRRVRRLR